MIRKGDKAALDVRGWVPKSERVRKEGLFGWLLSTPNRIICTFHPDASRPQERLRWLPTQEEHDELMLKQEDLPVVLWRDEKRSRTWWMFRGEFYWDNEGYEASELKALILQRQRARARKVERAISMMESEEAGSSRAPIPDDVKVLVWRRDQGKCVKCGSRENLEYDHIIPLARGGSNTARNIQLLCEACNRSKGGNLV